MGYTKHHAIVVTSWKEEAIEAAHAKAVELNCQPTPLPTEEMVNGYRSFMIPPDGSKEGWTESDVGDARRELFLRWVDAQALEDGSNSLEVVELSFGSDDSGASIKRHNLNRKPAVR